MGIACSCGQGSQWVDEEGTVAANLAPPHLQRWRQAGDTASTTTTTAERHEQLDPPVDFNVALHSFDRDNENNAVAPQQSMSFSRSRRSSSRSRGSRSSSVASQGGMATVFIVNANHDLAPEEFVVAATNPLLSEDSVADAAYERARVKRGGNEDDTAEATNVAADSKRCHSDDCSS
jgi:hypothetical protein